jgi:general secretion pathway protein C
MSAASVSVDDAGSLFGGKLTREANRSIRLVGILALREGAAAIVGVGNESPRAISLGGNLGNVGKLAEVHARSIVVDQGGARSEVFMPENTNGGPTIFVR